MISQHETKNVKIQTFWTMRILTKIRIHACSTLYSKSIHIEHLFTSKIMVNGLRYVCLLDLCQNILAKCGAIAYRRTTTD